MATHCLLIDDDQDDQEIFLMCLHEIKASIECRTCNSCDDAVSMLESDLTYIPEYIFIDVNMPKKNGLICLGLLKKMEHLCNAKIFMYSTTAESSALETSKKLGAEDFIIKPVRTAELKERLAVIFAV